jgi:hypothetical protein
MRKISIRRRSIIAAAAAGSLAAGLFVGLTPAQADVAPGSADIVGVGSDTLQFMVNFGADGDMQGNPGYNSGKLARVFSFDATPDANARAGYLNGSTNTALKALNPTIVLRAGGAHTIQRPNGSGAGASALIADTGSTHKVNFARSSSFISSGQISAADAATNVGALHVVRLAHEYVRIMTGTTTNAPTAGLTKAQLKSIYECTGGTGTGGRWLWSDAGIGGTGTDPIIPIVPQSGSGTRKTFLTDIGFTVDGSGNVTEAPGSCVATYEENDPYSLYVDANGNPAATDPYLTTTQANPDAIAPMSSARFNLYTGKDVYGASTGGYIYNPNAAYNATPPGGEQAILAPNVKLLTSGYSLERGLYVFFRDSDVAVTTTNHFNGTTTNWVHNLFLGSSAYMNNVGGGLGSADLISAGVSPDYADCGADPTSATTNCGPFGVDAP